MPTLSDKLKGLGVRLGAGNTGQEVKARKVPIETVVEGVQINTPEGEVFQAEAFYPIGHPHGSGTLCLASSLDLIGEWAGEGQIAGFAPEQFAFIDTETTGLSGGAGTIAFMVGAGRFEKDGFRLVQLFMREPGEEPALLHALEEFLATCKAVVSFNGKSFDLPLLQSRWIANGRSFPLKDIVHIDLLHLARRLWRDRLPDRSLGYLETHILNQIRTEEDTPGWMIPQMYFDYLRSRDARPMKGIFYHNAMDILTLAALTDHIAHLLADPLDGRVAEALDMAAIGKLNEELGYQEQAAMILTACLGQPLPADARSQVVRRLSFLHKRLGELPQALSLWWQAAADREYYAHEELAKYFEHAEKNYIEALKWTESALALLRAEGAYVERLQWEGAFEHRRKRLVEKLERFDGQGNNTDEPG
ncbi:MAG: ribonuclease H-like domain-containing protein [Anaerolineales bacterium]|nr:ribonuclease H-like domain-containing protein [Anaerolineales bacterium]